MVQFLVRNGGVPLLLVPFYLYVLVLVIFPSSGFLDPTMLVLMLYINGLLGLTVLVFSFYRRLPLMWHPSFLLIK